jgi:hypothetical protein
MRLDGHRTIFRAAAGLCCAGVLTVVMPQPASAGFFDRIFGGIRHVFDAPARPAVPFTDPVTSLINHFNPPQQEQLRGATATGPARAFCVRTCDGRYFPVQAHAGMSAAEACHSFCPASETRLFGGSNIDTATAPDGARYSDLPNAFAYRKSVVTGCTCNGRTNFGLAHIDASTDPTLRPGDVIATTGGLAAFTGTHNNIAEFTPVENYSRLPKNTRDKLAETKIAPPAPPTLPSTDFTGSIPAAAAQAHAEARN